MRLTYYLAAQDRFQEWLKAQCVYVTGRTARALGLGSLEIVSHAIDRDGCYCAEPAEARVYRLLWNLGRTPIIALARLGFLYDTAAQGYFADWEFCWPWRGNRSWLFMWRRYRRWRA